MDARGEIVCSYKLEVPVDILGGSASRPEDLSFKFDFLRVLYVSLNHWRMYAEDLFVFYTSSRVLVVRAWFF